VAGAAGAAGNLDALEDQLARAATNLTPLLDESWRRYLALPAEVFDKNSRLTSERLRPAVERFQAVAANPQYRALTERPEFQTTLALLRACDGAVAARGGQQLALPPPPVIGPR
jgi:hypothetical protein